MHHKLQMLTLTKYNSKPKRACEPCKVRRSPRKRLSPAPDDRREAISDEDDQDRQSTTNNEVNDTRSIETYNYTSLGNVLLPEMAIRTRLSYSFVPREDFFFFDDFHPHSTSKLTRFRLCDLHSFKILFSNFFPLFARTIYCNPIRLSKVTGGFGSKKCPCFIEFVFARVQGLPQ